MSDDTIIVLLWIRGNRLNEELTRWAKPAEVWSNSQYLPLTRGTHQGALTWGALTITTKAQVDGIVQQIFYFQRTKNSIFWSAQQCIFTINMQGHYETQTQLLYFSAFFPVTIARDLSQWSQPWTLVYNNDVSSWICLKPKFLVELDEIVMDPVRAEVAPVARALENQWRFYLDIGVRPATNKNFNRKYTVYYISLVHEKIEQIQSFKNPLNWRSNTVV